MDLLEKRKRQAAYQRRYAAKYPEKVRENSLRWAKNNPERANALVVKYRTANPEKAKASAEKWKANNPEKLREVRARNNVKRRSNPSVPAWGNKFFIAEIYDLAQRRTKATGVEWEVDHIVPLCSKVVSGLHVEHNLQVILKTHNRAKSNKYWPDMPQQGV